MTRSGKEKHSIAPQRLGTVTQSTAMEKTCSARHGNGGAQTRTAMVMQFVDAKRDGKASYREDMQRKRIARFSKGDV